MLDSSLLLAAYQPASSWADRTCGYRQWRLIPGEMLDPEEEKSEVPRQALTTNSFLVTDVLGEGNYSQVMFAVLRSTQLPVALKVVDKAKLKRYKKEDEVRVERWVLSNLKHPSIIKMYGTFQDVGAIYLALELLPGGELWAKAHKTGLVPSRARFYCAQVLEVLQFLHERGVSHRDVKPENVLLTRDGHVKLIDFGTAKLLEGQLKMSEVKGDDRRTKFKEFIGTPEYMAPEAINNKPTDHRADLWSFAGFVTMLLTGFPAFKGGSDYLTFKRVLARKYRLPEGIPAAAASLIDALLALEPERRLGAGPLQSETAHAAVRAHPFFAGCRGGDLHRAPLPVPTLLELCTPGACDALEEAVQSGVPPSGAAPTSWPDGARDPVVFALGRREKLDVRMRALLGLGPELPPLADDLEEWESGEKAPDGAGTVV